MAGFEDFLLKQAQIPTVTPQTVAPTAAPQPTQAGGFESFLRQKGGVAEPPRAITPPAAAPVAAPAKEKEAEFSPFGGLKVLGTELLEAPAAIASTLTQAIQGQSGQDVVAPDFFERGVDIARKRTEERSRAVAAEYGEDYFLPGIQVKDVAGLSQNLGFSLTSLGAGLGAAALTGTVTAPSGPGAVLAATGASVAAGGAVAYRAASADITKRFLEAKQEEIVAERGTGMTAEEQAQFKEEFSSLATEFGLWEAIPEAIGNIPAAGLVARPFAKIAGKLLGKSAASKTLTGLGAKYAGIKGLAKATATELATEAVTEVGQSQTLKNTIIGDPDPLDWNVADFGQALKNVAPQTLLLMGVLKGGGSVANKALDAAEYRKSAPQLKALQAAHPAQTFTKAGGGLYEVTAGEGEAQTTVKGSPTLIKAVLNRQTQQETKQDAATIEKGAVVLQEEQVTIQEQLTREDLEPNTRANLETAQQTNAEALANLGVESQQPAVATPEAAGVPAPEVQAKPTQTKVTKTQLTAADRTALARLGLTGSDIRVLKPQEGADIIEAAKKMPDNTNVIRVSENEYQMVDTQTGDPVGEVQPTRAAAILQNATEQDSSSSTARFITEQLNQGVPAEEIAVAVNMDAQRVMDIYNDEIHGDRLTGPSQPDVAPAPPTPAPADINPVVDILQRKLNQYLAPSGLGFSAKVVPTPKGQEKLVTALSELFGKQVHFFESTGGFEINGAFLKEESEHIFINADTQNPVKDVIGHELIHAMRQDNPELYAELVELSKTILNVTGENFDQMIAAYAAQLQAAKRTEGIEVTQEELIDEATEEFIANELGGMILDGWFLAEVYKADESMFNTIMAAIDSILLKIKATIDPSQHSAIDAVQTEIDAILKDYHGVQKLSPEEATAANAEFAPTVDPRFSRETDNKIAMLTELSKLGADPFAPTQGAQQPIEVSGGQTGQAPGSVRAVVEGLGSRTAGIFESAGSGPEATRLASNASRITATALADGSLTADTKENYYTRLVSAFEKQVPIGATAVADAKSELKKLGFTGLETDAGFVEALMQAHAAFEKFKASGRNLRFSRKLDPLGFYSPLEASVNSLFDQPILTGKQVQAKLDKAKKRDQKNFKQEEIDYVGLEEYLQLNADEKLTEAQVSAFVGDEGVKVEEVQGSELGNMDFSKYQLPGGVDYREVLLTLPDAAGEFQSAHFNRPNVLAHARLNSRILANGEKVLFIEEIQSDWNIEGRKRGFTGEGYTVQRKDGRASFFEEKVYETREEAEEVLRVTKNPESYSVAPTKTGIVPAPFVTSSAWQNLIMKRIIRIAAEENSQRISWITGEQTAGRYSLDKEVSRILFTKDGDGYITVIVDNQDRPQLADTYTADQLPGVVGKEIADRIVKSSVEGKQKVIQGEDLKIEAQWARNLYDKAIPTFMNKFGKPYDVKVEEVKISDGAGGTTKQQSLPLNEGINQEVVMVGLPLFSRPGEFAANIQEKLLERGTNAAELIKEMAKNPRHAKLRIFPTLLKAVPLPFKVEMFSKRLPKLKALERSVRKYTAAKDGIVTRSQTLYDELKKVAKNAKGLEKVNIAAATASLFQVDPRTNIMKQDWIPGNMSGQAGLDAAEQSWTAAGMVDVTGGMSLQEAHKFAKAQYNALPADVQKAYSDIVDDTAAIRVREQNAAIAQIQELEDATPEQQQEMTDNINNMFGSLKGAYLPLGRFGDYVVMIKDADGKTIFRSQHATPERAAIEAEAMKANLNEGDRIITDVVGEAVFDKNKQVPAEFRDQVSQLADIKFTQGLDPQSDEGLAAAKQSEDFKEDLFQLWLRNAPEGSSLKNSVRRKGVAGFDEDMMRSYIEYMMNHAASVAYSEEGRHINRLLNDMDRDTQNKINMDLEDSTQDDANEALVDKVILADVRQHIESARVSQSSVLAQAAGKVSLVWYLSSPSQFMVQLSQLGILTLPRLASRYGLTSAANALTRALQKALTPTRYNPAHIAQMDPLYDRITATVTTQMVQDAQAAAENNERLRSMGIQPRPEDITAAEMADAKVGVPLHNKEEQNRMIEAEIGDDQYKQDLMVLRMAVAENLLDITLSHAALEVQQGRDRSGVIEKFAFFIRESELASRKAATLAGFDLEYKKNGGTDFIGAFDEAGETNTKTLFDYSKEARPYLLRANAWASVISQFQVFRVSMLFHLGGLMHKSFRSMQPQERKTAQKELAGVLGVVVALGGVTALPFVSTLIAAFELLAGDDDEPVLTWLELRNALRNSIGDTGADAVMNGLPTMLGGDISGRVGLDSIFEPSSAPPEYMNAAQTSQWAAANLLGPSWGVIEGFGKGIDLMEKGETLKATAAMLPKLFRDPLKALDTALNGARTSQGRAIMEEGALNPVELLLMSAGINPNDFARASEANRNLSTVGARISERRGMLMREYAQAYDNEDVDGRDDVMEEIHGFNAAQPQFAISGPEISTIIKRGIKNQMAILSVRELLIARKYDIDVHRIEGQR